MTTAKTTSPDGVDSLCNPFVAFWTEAWQKSTELTQAAFQGMTKAGEWDKLRRQWSAALSTTLDNYMRSPAFLENMRRNMEMITEWQSHMDDWARDLSRLTGLPHVSDVSGLFDRLKQNQEAILAQLSAIEKRLQAMEERSQGRGS